MESALAEADRKIEALNDADAAMRQETEALVAAVSDAAQQEIDALKGSAAEAQQKADALKAALDAAQKEIDALRGEQDATQEKLDALTKQMQQLLDSIPPEEPIEKIRIYIDQGHNPTSYHNAGAQGNGLYEQDVTFTVGYLLAQLLVADGRFEVCLSRPTIDTVLGKDSASSLQARVQGAQDFDADLFISLHTNAFDDENVRGVEVLVAEQGGASHTLASHLLSGVIVSAGLHNRGVKLRPDLYVLANATMPAVLLEMGFITNADDAAVMSKTPERFAQGVYEGLLTYFAFSPVS